MQKYKDITGLDLSIQSPVNQREKRLETRPLSEQAAFDIRTGHYDLAMPDIPEHWQRDGQSKLSLVMPDPEEASSLEENLAIVENADQLGLEQSPVVPYPSMALIAHLQGDVS